MFLLMPKSCTEQLHRTPNGQLPASPQRFICTAFLTPTGLQASQKNSFFASSVSILQGVRGPIEEQTGHLRLHTKVLCTIDNFFYITQQPLVLHNLLFFTTKKRHGVPSANYLIVIYFWKFTTPMSIEYTKCPLNWVFSCLGMWDLHSPRRCSKPRLPWRSQIHM